MSPPITRADAARLDAEDPLAHCRARFSLPDGVIYLDGNSLGAMPKAVPARMSHAIEQEWAVGLIRSWNDADWYPAPQRVGGRIAKLIGAAADDVRLRRHWKRHAIIETAEFRDLRRRARRVRADHPGVARPDPLSRGKPGVIPGGRAPPLPFVEILSQRQLRPP